MKKIIFAIVGMLMLSGNTIARPVDASKARRIAEVYMGAKGMKNPSALQDITSQTPFTEFYLFASADGGFILVSADDCIIPVLGYSLQGRFETKEMPAHIMAWFERYENMIRRSRTLAAAEDLPPTAQWNDLTNGTPQTPLLTTSVAPMLTTTWDQAPYYNTLCPADANVHPYYQGHVVTGCVATATAQIMKFWNYPTTGYGSHSYVHPTYGTLSANFGTTTYDWANMPNALTSASSATQVNTIATLMYHIGVADEMNYTVQSSGASNYQSFGSIRASSQNSLVAYFKYSPDMAFLVRDNMGDSLFSAALRAELDLNRPILFSGFDESAGHSFVLDGYDNTGNFHINWGWGGSCDGYYQMGYLVPAQSGIGGNNGSYNLSDVALIGIRPNTSWGQGGTVTVATDGTPGCTVSGGGSYTFGDTITPRVQSVPSGYRFVQWSDGQPSPIRQFIGTGGNFSYTAQFSQLHGDTLGYCGNMSVGTFGSVYDDTWSIKLPASVLTSGHNLSAVQFYVAAAGNYTISVYNGSPSAATLAWQGTTAVTDEDCWHTFNLPSAVAIDGTSDLYISISCSNVPVAVTFGSGNPDGYLWGSNFYAYNGYTFMIRGIFSQNALPPNPVDQCVVSTFPYTETFEDGISTLNCWTILDADGDGFNWIYFSNGTESLGHSSLAALGSASWDSDQGALTPDNWLFSPGYALPASQPMYLKWYAKGQAETDYAENYTVYISTTGTNPAAFTTVLYSGTTTNQWQQQGVNLSAYAGDTVHIAFRHHNTTDMFYLLIDDVEISASAPQPTQYTLTVTSNNPAWGTVSGGGTYNSGATAILTATPSTGYRFVRWNDNNTQNPRTVTVTANATYTATFEAIPPTTYTITVLSNNDAWGTVSGGGTYNSGATATLTASPKNGYRFKQWNDGNTQNPRTVTVTGNKTYIATFESNVGIDETETATPTLYPNPATSVVSIQGIEGNAVVTVTDITGRQVAQFETSDSKHQFDVSQLARGSYFVRIATNGDTTIHKLIVK